MSPAESHVMQCMEIWGGNRAARESVETPGLDIFVFSQPYHSETRGGDVHYVSLCGGGIITRLIIADVSGHGELVAGFSQNLRNLMRRNINRKSQGRLVKELNRQFTEMADSRRFATAVVATYLATTERLSVCNAAHPRPLRYDSTRSEWSILSHESAEVVESAMNIPLGIDTEATYDQFSIPLRRGDLILFYTDALTEAMNPSGTLLGESGLLELARGIKASDPEEFGASLLDAVRLYRDGEPADDDVTILVLRGNGGPRRTLSIGEKVEVYARVFGLKKV